MADQPMSARPAPFAVQAMTVMLILLALVALPACRGAEIPAGRQPVRIADRSFDLELALDDAARVQGLSDRKSIAQDGGMLFVFPDAAVRQFVMRRCYVAIDILFISPAGRITAMHEMQVEPIDRAEDDLHRYSSSEPAIAAIELAGGTIRTLGVKPGQRIDLPWEDLKRRAR